MSETIKDEVKKYNYNADSKMVRVANDAYKQLTDYCEHENKVIGRYLSQLIRDTVPKKTN